MLGYSFYLNKNWRESWSSDYLTPIYTDTTEELNWLIAFGAEFDI